jgi:hypothetical protein
MYHRQKLTQVDLTKYPISFHLSLEFSAKISYAFLVSLNETCRSCLIFLDLITLIFFDDDKSYKDLQY